MTETLVCGDLVCVDLVCGDLVCGDLVCVDLVCEPRARARLRGERGAAAEDEEHGC